MKNVLTHRSGQFILLSNVDDGTNRLFINGEEIPSSSWVGSGAYTKNVDGVTITITKIDALSGNIVLKRATDTSFRLQRKGEPEEYLPLSGGTMKGNIAWKDSNALPQFSGRPSFLLGIEAFANGGATKWKSASEVSVGYVNGHTVNKDVPANADFTNTWPPIAKGSSVINLTVFGQKLGNFSGYTTVVGSNGHSEANGTWILLTHFLSGTNGWWAGSPSSVNTGSCRVNWFAY